MRIPARVRGAGHIKRGKTYQVIDPFVRFSIAFLQGARKSSWTAYRGTPAYFAWAGNAFELACLNHVAEIKNALGIAGVENLGVRMEKQRKQPRRADRPSYRQSRRRHKPIGDEIHPVAFCHRQRL